MAPYRACRTTRRVWRPASVPISVYPLLALFLWDSAVAKTNKHHKGTRVERHGTSGRACQRLCLWWRWLLSFRSFFLISVRFAPVGELTRIRSPAHSSFATIVLCRLQASETALEPHRAEFTSSACWAAQDCSFAPKCWGYLCASPNRPRVPPVWIMATLVPLLSPLHRSTACSQADKVYTGSSRMPVC